MQIRQEKVLTYSTSIRRGMDMNNIKKKSTQRKNVGFSQANIMPTHPGRVDNSQRRMGMEKKAFAIRYVVDTDDERIKDLLPHLDKVMNEAYVGIPFAWVGTAHPVPYREYEHLCFAQLYQRGDSAHA